MSDDRISLSNVLADLLHHHSVDVSLGEKTQTVETEVPRLDDLPETRPARGTDVSDGATVFVLFVMGARQHFLLDIV
jgi:hypothetical protein